LKYIKDNILGSQIKSKSFVVEGENVDFLDFYIVDENNVNVLNLDESVEVDSGVDSSNLDGLMTGKCDLYLRIVPKGRGDELSKTNIAQFKEKNFKGDDVIVVAGEKDVDLFSTSFEIANVKVDEKGIPKVEVIDPFENGNVCVNDDGLKFKIVFADAFGGVNKFKVKSSVSFVDFDFTVEMSERELKNNDYEYSIDMGDFKDRVGGWKSQISTKSGLKAYLNTQILNDKGESVLILPKHKIFVDYSNTGDCSSDYLLTEVAEAVVVPEKGESDSD